MTNLLQGAIKLFEYEMQTSAVILSFPIVITSFYCLMWYHEMMKKLKQVLQHFKVLFNL